MANPLRNIPSVNELLENPSLRTLVDRASHSVVVSGVRDFLDNLRSEVQAATSDINLPSANELAERIAEWIVDEQRPSLRPVINATGVLLHTGLGRAPLPEAAIAAIADVSRDYASVELDLATGKRSTRAIAIEQLLRKITGCEAATVVNNNAAATLITLAALAKDKEVVVSRGQLVEIGGSYRLPDVMTASGAHLKEVGTTNKTRISDYEQAITPETGALLHVHTSNYVIQGFSESPSIEALIALAHKKNLPLIDDIGSGALWDFSRYGVAGEPSPQQSIKAGADVVLFSGDKLLGGPQCGIILGKRTCVEAITCHPLARAMRVDKITLAALAATLRLYQAPEQAEQTIPLLMLLSAPIENLRNRAERLAPQLAESEAIAAAQTVESESFLGGGSMPNQHIPTWCIALKPARDNVDSLAARLRNSLPAVCGRVHNDTLLIDLRTVFPRQDHLIVQAVQTLTPKTASDASDAKPVVEKPSDEQG